MFFDIDIPSLFARALETNEAKTLSFVTGFLRSMGVDVTATNEVVLDLKTFERLKQ